MSVVDELKLTKVVLFKAGIGSFQKHGLIDLKNKKTVRVSFKNTVMNDLLKTFSILRLSGDLVVSGVSYEAQETDRAKMLENSDINLPEENAFSALLEQLRGVKVKIMQFDKSVEGKVLGIQTFQEAPTGQAVVDRDYVLLALDDSKIKPIQITEITGIDILDTKIRQDFQFFLETITGQNKEKNKTITLFFNGKENSEYILNFLQEVPAWKTTYRVFFENSQPSDADKDKQNSGEELALNLQGWAIIDNVLDEDWEDVDLTLVTGLPVSFIYDSYSPAWIVRPTIERKTDLGIKVVQFERSFDTLASDLGGGGPKAKAAMRRMDRMAMAGAPGAPPPRPCAAPMMAKSMIAPMEMMDKEMDMDDFALKEEEAAEPEATFETTSEAQGGKGLAFKYHIKNPVFVKRNNSSLIPLLQTDLKGFLICVYNVEVNEKHPLTTLKFINLGPSLEEGPISVFQNKTFAGEAMLPFLEQKGEARIPFAVDQGVEINKKTDTRSNKFHEIVIEREIYKRYFTIQTVTYNIKNISEFPKKLVIEHQKSHRFELFDTGKPNEETAKFFRFNMDIEPNSKAELVIKERRLDYSSETATHLTSTIIDDWLKAKLIGVEEKEFLLDRIKLEHQYNTINSEIANLVSEEGTISSEQDRLRENLRALRQSDSEKRLREKYIDKFEKQESRLEELTKSREQMKKDLEQIQQKIDTLIRDWIKKKQEEREKAASSKKAPQEVPKSTPDAKSEAKSESTDGSKKKTQRKK